MRFSYLYFLILCIILFSCTEKIRPKHFNYLISEPTMIVNSEQDNSIEGNYLRVNKINIQDSSFTFNIPNNFKINNANIKDWIVGWGQNKPLYDGGVENLRKIKKIDLKKGKIYFDKIQRGKGFPTSKQRIVFWNSAPSGFKNNQIKPIIDTRIWPQFSGESINFSSVVFDKSINKWVIIVNECDTSKIQIYAATSENLIEWKAANNGKPILTSKHFKNCKWAGKDKSGKINQTPFVSDILLHDNKWYLFMDGYDKSGKRSIGYAISEKSSLGKYKVSKKPILIPDKKGSWNEEAVFYAKVKKYKRGFILFYDGRNSEGSEKIGTAFSNDLVHWSNSSNNPIINQHVGWRSEIGCTEPNHIEIRNDSIFLMIAGVKKLKMGAWHHYVTKRMYLDVSGNVNDAQLGLYLSTDGGKTFIPHINNPIFSNDYTNKYENEHMGGNFKIISTDTSDFIIYQAKSSYKKLKYNILIRERKN